MAAMSELVGAVRTRPGWSDLPSDLLQCVLARLPVPDRIRFPAVCTAWGSAASALHPRAVPVPSPWLMLPFDPTARRGRGGGKFSEKARFLSLSDGKVYAVPQPVPAIPDRLCVGSSPEGWLVTADAASELHLLNPLSGAQVPLPPPDTLPFVHASRDADGRVVSYSLRCCFADDDGDEGATVIVPPESFAPDRLRYELYKKAILVSAPREGHTAASGSGPWGSYAVMLIYQPLSRIAIARAGDTRWTLLDTPSRRWADAVRASSSASAGGRQLVYAMDSAGRVDAWDVDVTADTTTMRKAIAPSYCCCSGRACSMSAACSRYLVELSPGRLLQVHRVRDAAHARYTWEPRPESIEYTTVAAEFFELIGGRWAPVDSRNGRAGIVAGHALFLGKNASLCVPVDDCPELRGNCVYFTDDGPWSHDRCREVAPDVGVLDLADGSYRPPRGAARDLLWKWPPPVWVFPSCVD
ncbi:hypothetical protein D1007_06842 [Hordeum vulgare]|uniref:F-box domain-containing protein n=1 Tax=Hordeum vulgare subsp. vulgare TaxID=112509 RepID=A0A8I6YQR6_HORVV|nr:uncharacterized protein LOC123409301 [Hordeum vulgare subsp. vulgare]KAE8815781.1 hypothetical protein D1007_06842 [Hordeum vulgare]